jgi:hypothetical protein
MVSGWVVLAHNKMHLQLHASLIVDPIEGKHPAKVGAMDLEF